MPAPSAVAPQTNPESKTPCPALKAPVSARKTEECPSAAPDGVQPEAQWRGISTPDPESQGCTVAGGTVKEGFLEEGVLSLEIW